MQNPTSLPAKGDVALQMATHYGQAAGHYRATHHHTKWGNHPYRSAWRQFREQFPDEDQAMLREWYFHAFYSTYQIHRQG